MFNWLLCRFVGHRWIYLLFSRPHHHCSRCLAEPRPPTSAGTARLFCKVNVTTSSPFSANGRHHGVDDDHDGGHRSPASRVRAYMMHPSPVVVTHQVSRYRRRPIRSGRRTPAWCRALPTSAVGTFRSFCDGPARKVAHRSGSRRPSVSLNDPMA